MPPFFPQGGKDLHCHQQQVLQSSLKQMPESLSAWKESISSGKGSSLWLKIRLLFEGRVLRRLLALWQQEASESIEFFLEKGDFLCIGAEQQETKVSNHTEYGEQQLCFYICSTEIRLTSPTPTYFICVYVCSTQVT